MVQATAQTNIYFLGSYLCLNHFFSVWESSARSLILVNDNPNLVEFLKVALPEENIDTLNIPSFTWNLWKFPWIFYQRIILIRRLRLVRTPANAYYFCNGYTLNFFMLIEYLIRKGWCVRFVNAEPHLALKEFSLSIRLRFRLLLIRFFLRTRVSFARNQWWVTFFYSVIDDSSQNMQLLSWQKVGEKLKLSEKFQYDDGVLFIDAPLHSYQGVDVEHSQESLCQWIEENMKADDMILLKPHPAAASHSFSGTRLEGRIKMIPAFIPAEILLLNRKFFLAFTTGAANTFNGKVLSLANVLKFDDNSSRVAFWEHFKQCMVAKNIEVVDFSGGVK